MLDQSIIHFSDVGFTFAGHTAAGNITHSLAAAGLQNLIGQNNPKSGPSVEETANYYARCAELVVKDLSFGRDAKSLLFEGLVFGWDANEAVAYSLEFIMEGENAICESSQVNFSESPLQAIGQGIQEVEAYLMRQYANGRSADPFETLSSIISNHSVVGVGGGMQGAYCDSEGVQLKPVLRVHPSGKAVGGYFGANLESIGSVGGFCTLNPRPICLPETFED